MLYFLTFVYISFYYIRPTEWMPGILGLPIFNLFGILCVASLVGAALTGKIRLLNGNTEKMMIGFVSAIICSHLSHGYVGGAINSLTNLLPTIVGYYLLFSVINSRDRFNGFVLLLIMLTTFLSYEGWLQYTTGFAHGGIAPIIEIKRGLDGVSLENTRIRWYGVFSDPNDLGLVLVVVIPFLLNMGLHRRYLVPACCLPLIVSAIYFTNSRGSYLALLAAILVYFVIRYRSKTGVVVGMLLAAILFTLGPSRMAEVSTADSGRIEAWHQGFQMFKANPLFGVGQGMFTEDYPLTAHNSFVLVMAELGFVGLFFFTGLIYYPVNWLWINVFRNQQDNLPEADLGLISAVFSSLIGVLAAMFFLSRSYNLVPFILIALATVSTRICTPDGNDRVAPCVTTDKHLKNIAIITVLQIVFINIIVKVFI